MRYDTPVYLYATSAHDSRGVYNKETGDYSSPVLCVMKTFGSVSDTGIKPESMSSGQPERVLKTIRLDMPAPNTADFVVVNGMKYTILNRKHYGRSVTLFVEEIGRHE